MCYDVNVCKQWLYVDHCRHDGNHFNVVVGAVVMMLMMMMVMARYPCLTYQSTLPSYFQSLLTPWSYSLISFFTQLSLCSYSLVSQLHTFTYSYQSSTAYSYVVLTCAARWSPDNFFAKCHFSTRARHTDRTIVISLNQRYSHLNLHPFCYSWHSSQRQPFRGFSLRVKKHSIKDWVLLKTCRCAMCKCINI